MDFIMRKDRKISLEFAVEAYRLHDLSLGMVKIQKEIMNLLFFIIPVVALKKLLHSK